MMEFLSDPTVSSVLFMLLLATTIGMFKARRRDPCLVDFSDFHISLAQKDGDLSWGEIEVYTTAIEMHYVESIISKHGHKQQSYIFYKDEFKHIDALFRYAPGLSDEQAKKREKVIRKTANPGLWRKIARRLRNWLSMVRDAALQAVSLFIGAAKTSSPGSIVLNQEKNLKSLSSEIIGYAGNAFDPMLERHLFKQVVIEVVQNGKQYSYCGWLKDYTSEFIEILGARLNDWPAAEAKPFSTSNISLPNVSYSIENRKAIIKNESNGLLYIKKLESKHDKANWTRFIGAILPPGYTVDTIIPQEVNLETLNCWIGYADEVDLVVPRTHALVRHAAYEETGGTLSRLINKSWFNSPDKIPNEQTQKVD